MIRVFSRANIENWYREFPEDTTPVISLNDIGYDSPVPDNHPRALRLWFDDVSPFLVKHDLHHQYYKECEKQRSLVLFDDCMAELVSEFLYGLLMDSEKDLLVHCHAGVSRSVAVAVYAHLLYGYTLGDLQGVNYEDCRMNSYVFGKLLKYQKGGF